MDKVAEKLKIDVTEEEINGHIAQLAIRRGQRPERVREEMARSGSLAQFRLQVREDKCVAKLLESAKITDVEPVKKAEKPAKESGKTAKKASEKPVKAVGKEPAQKAPKAEKKNSESKKEAKKETKKTTKKKTDK